ncbi:MAG: hydrogenase maturation protease [Bacteroidales bacterium]
MKPLVILGIGNLLLTDDGVGVHAARALERDPPDGAVVCEVGTAVFDALAVLEKAGSVIAIDAIDAGEAPGTIVQFDLEDDRATAPVSLHAFDLPALVHSIASARRPRVTVIGIQPAVVELGLDLSSLILARLPDLVRAVRELAIGRLSSISS